MSDFVNMKHSKQILSITSAAVDALSSAREVHKDKRAELREGLEQATPSVPRTRKDVTQSVSSRHQNPFSPLNHSLSSPTTDDRGSDQVNRENRDQSSSSLFERSFNGTQRVRVPSRMLREIKSPLERSSSSSDSKEAPGVIRIGKVYPEKRLTPTIMDKSLGTNSHLTRAKPTVRREFIYTCSAPPPPPLQCWTSVHAISPEFQHCMGGRGGEGKATQFETENSAFVKLRFKNAEN